MISTLCFPWRSWVGLHPPRDQIFVYVCVHPFCKGDAVNLDKKKSLTCCAKDDTTKGNPCIFFILLEIMNDVCRVECLDNRMVMPDDIVDANTTD